MSDAELLVLIAAVAKHANPAAPTLVSKRAFNNARRPAGCQHCPEASNLCRRFSSGWPDLLALAFHPNSFQATVAREREARDSETRGTDLRTCVAALAFIARREGVSTLRPHEYDQARAAALKAHRGSRRAELAARLPTSGQIGTFGPWDELLQAAGLQPRATEQPRAADGLNLVDASDWFLQAQGWLPSHDDLRRFAREHDFALPRLPKGALQAARNDLRQRRDTQGIYTPAATPPAHKGHKKPKWTTVEQQASNGTIKPVLAGAAPRRQSWNLELVQQGLLVALGLLGPRERLNQPTLRRLAASDERVPDPATVGLIAKKHETTFSALRAEAIEARALRT